MTDAEIAEILERAKQAERQFILDGGVLWDACTLLDDLPAVCKELLEARRLLEAWSIAAGSIGPRGMEILTQQTRAFLGGNS